MSLKSEDPPAQLQESNRPQVLSARMPFQEIQATVNSYCSWALDGSSKETSSAATQNSIRTAKANEILVQQVDRLTRLKIIDVQFAVRRSIHQPDLKNAAPPPVKISSGIAEKIRPALWRLPQRFP
ncbi:MAG: hypothetical protein JO025_21990 [Verrucomicrobia bacterium]|nr:hypothetical protein [Verrucomicrobiota bacterium]